MIKKRVTIIFLLGLTAVALYFCYVIAEPFMKPIITAAVIAIIFYPVHARLHKAVRSPSGAALLSTVTVILIIVIPAIALVHAIAGDLRDAYESLSLRSAAGGGWTAYLAHLTDAPLAWIGRHVNFSGFDLRADLRSRLEQASAGLLGEAGGVAGNLASFLVNAAITFFALFFLFREGKAIRRQTAAILPLDPARTERLLSVVSDAVVANVHGVLAVGAAQGTLAGAAFWALGLPSPILWGAVTALCSLVPVVGSGIVWAPASLILLISGHWVKALVMLGWGGGVVSVADHIIRPFVVRGRVKMNTLFLVFALLGGVEAFGILGLFIGPMVFSITLALFSMLREEGRAWHLSWDEPKPAPPSEGATT
ncbi:MAG TPA: AI-2E family transporter [Terriglobia bacterium]|nr:AI-2E family transporter [Terriglobia bacterium]